jgi:hypothetical protein
MRGKGSGPLERVFDDVRGRISLSAVIIGVLVISVLEPSKIVLSARKR